MTDDNRQKILDKIDASKDDAVAFLREMVSIPSVTGDEAAIQKFVSNYMMGVGLDVDMWETDWEELKKHPGYRPVDRGYEGRPNIVATLKGTGGGRSLLLNGHTDVIPVGNGEGWSENPWSASVKDGRIYGRGSCDMKSGVASHILAVQYLKELGLTPKGDVMINVVIDEEVSGHGTLDTVIRGYKADAGISGETSDLAVQPACIGRIWFEIEIQGKPAGIQQRYLGISGIDLGNKIAKAVADLEAKRIATVTHPLYPECDRLVALYRRQLPGGQLSKRLSGKLLAEGQHRHSAGRGPRGRQAESGRCGRGSCRAGSVDEVSSAKGPLRRL